MKKTKLFCIPYAGGSASVYYKWKPSLKMNCELIPLELKGRGERFSEESYKNFDELLHDLYEKICCQLNYADDYYLFGHSMGAFIAYKLALIMENEHKTIPKHIFFSGREAPRYAYSNGEKAIASLGDKEFLSEIIKLGGMTKELLEDKENMRIFMPILREDFKLCESVDFNECTEKISCDISVLNGIDDIVEKDSVHAWKDYSEGECEIRYFNGKHFFINDSLKEVVNYINSKIE